MSQSKLEVFASEVATTLTAGDAGIDPIAIIALIEKIMEIVMTLIDNCPQSSFGKIAATILTPGLYNKVRFNRLVRKVWNDCDFADVTYDQVAEACAKVAATKSIEDVTSVVKEVRTIDYLLI
jgi:hypothetical protein